MLHVETINLEDRRINLPSDRIGMVVAQPHLLLTPTEPYRCKPEARDKHLTAIHETLAVAMRAPHGAARTHFTLFPEYSIPGSVGVETIQNTLETDAWPTETFVLGGVEGLTKAEFIKHLDFKGTHFHEKEEQINQIAEHEWINCCFIWAKDGDGNVERWLQPKLCPAWEEQNIHCQEMYRGTSVFAFKGLFENGTRYLFSTLVCFDWIGKINHKPVSNLILEALNEKVKPDEASLSWLFILENNPKPSHDSFLNGVTQFFDQSLCPNVRRDRACLVFANSAGLDRPGRSPGFGGTSTIFSPQALFRQPTCHPTYSNGGPKYRENEILRECKDIYFREKGACVHSFTQINPASLALGPPGRRLPIENAFVFPLNGTADPRVPGGPVPACVKWVNDELDAVGSLSTRHPGIALAHPVSSSQERQAKSLREIDELATSRSVCLAACGRANPSADQWERNESEAIEHLVHTLAILGLPFEILEYGADPGHAVIQIRRSIVELYAIKSNHHEECLDHWKSLASSAQRQSVLVSRDTDNTDWTTGFESILKTNTSILGQEQQFTDPEGGLLHIGYGRLLQILLASATEVELERAINAELSN